MAKATERALAERLLDGLAKVRSLRTGEAYEKAYGEVLRSDEGREVYSQHCDASAAVERGADPRVAGGDAAQGTTEGHLRKSASAERTLDAMARATVDATGLDYAKAYLEVLSSPEGRALYAGHAEAKEAAAQTYAAGR